MYKLSKLFKSNTQILSIAINRVAAMASRSQPGQHYYVLVILTDGIITDLFQTKEAIIKASVFPMSIIIVGVGDADFSAMQLLDGDEGAISFMGCSAERDIVQFVEYRNAEHWYKTAGGEGSTYRNYAPEPGKAAGGFPSVVSNIQKEMTILLAQSKLAVEVLAEVPGQVVAYMKGHGIEPSMIKMKDAKPEEIFVVVEGTDVMKTFNKMHKSMVTKKEERKKEEERRTKKIEHRWNLGALVGVGTGKFYERTARGRTPLPGEQRMTNFSVGSLGEETN